MGIRTRSQAVLSLPKLPVTLLSGFLGAGDTDIALIPHLTLAQHSHQNLVPSSRGCLPFLQCLRVLFDHRTFIQEHLENVIEPMI